MTRYLLLASSLVAGFTLAAGRFDADLKKNEFTVTGSAEFIRPAEGGLLADTGSGTGYRWVSLTSPKTMYGDFTVELDFRMQHFDHWNAFRLLVAGKDFSAALYRRQKAKGVEELAAAVNVKGKKSEETATEKGRSGTLRLERRGSVLTFRYRPEGGEFRDISVVKDFPEGEVSAGIAFDNPARTMARVLLTGFRQEWQGEPVLAFQPTYLPERPLGTGQLVVLEGGRRLEDGSVELTPGGRAIYGVEGPLNLLGHRLEWRSSGALKLAATRIGGAETLELGETVLWDEKGDFAEFKTRSLGLGTFVGRSRERRRGWEYPHLTSDNLYFIAVRPAGAELVRFAGLTLLGRTPGDFKQPKAETVKAGISEEGNRRLLAWQPPAAAAGWFDKAKAPEGKSFGGIPFALSLTRLSKECPAIEIPVNAKAGGIHLLHAAGPQGEGAVPTLAVYRLLYEDGGSEAIFAVSRWNCGVYRTGYQKRGMRDFTWWGPPGFSWAEACYLPRGAYGVDWDSLYRASYRNPHPDKMIRSIIASLPTPGDERSFGLAGITLDAPETAVIGLIEPETAAFPPGKPLELTLMEYRPVPVPAGEVTVEQKKSAAAAKLAEVRLSRAGHFGGAVLRVTPQAEPGPVRFTAGGFSSSLLGLLPAPAPADRPSYLTMIAGGAESRSEFERMRRLGYDAVKIHLPWVESEEGNVSWPNWPERLNRITAEELKIGFRNHIGESRPPALQGKVATLVRYGGKEPGPMRAADPADPVYRERVVNYYRETARLANRYPNVYSINANYGIRGGLGVQALAIGPATLVKFRQELAKEFTLEELNRQLGTTLAGFDGVTPELIMKDATRTLLPRLTRLNMADLGSLQREVTEAIRGEGCRVHLTYNVPFHPIEHKLIGLNTTAYLELSRDYPPGSIFHETSDRYCLSFNKWLLAGRTLGLPYGDEGNQPPPTYEHNVLSYQWMAMMQCFDALYCQWFSGRPAGENIAWLKPYSRLLYNAEYLPDPISLAFSLDTGFAESADTFHKPFHGRTGAHYSLANLLRELNFNPDRYLADRFPELDAKVTSKLLIDDMTRDLAPAFGDRIEAFIRKGGVFLASFDTDRLNSYAFFKRFGIEVSPKGEVSGMNSVPGSRKVAEKVVGQGRIVLLQGTWHTGHWDPGEAPEYRESFRRLLQKYGEFAPLVKTDVVDVFATPYRTRAGEVLIQLFNITAAAREVNFGVSAGLCKGTPALFDLGAGAPLQPRRDGGYWSAAAEVAPFSSTVIRMTPGR